MALFFSDKQAPALRLKRGDYKDSEELQQLFRALSEDPALQIGDLLWALSDPKPEVRRLASQLVVHRQLSGAFAAVFNEATTLSGPQQRALLALLPQLVDGAALGLLERAIQEGKGETQRLGTEVLFQLPPQRAYTVLVNLVRSTNTDLRLRALGRIAEGLTDGQPLDPRLRALFAAAASDADERVRIQAFEVLARFPDAQFVDFVLQRLRTERAAVKKRLVEILERSALQRDPRVLDRLVPLLGEHDAFLRLAGLRLAARAGDPAQVAERLVAFSRSVTGWMRERIHDTVAQLGEALVDPLLDLAGRPDQPQPVRASALVFATHSKSPRLVERCAALLSDPDPWLRLVAIDVLRRLGNTHAVEPLLRCVQHPELKWPAISALTALRAPQVLPAVAPLLTEPAPESRLQALEVLGTFADPRTLPLVKKVHGAERDPRVRQQALATLRLIAERNGQGDDPALAATDVAASTSGRALDALLVEARRLGASDLHLIPGERPALRKDGDLARWGDRPMEPARARAMVLELLRPEQRAALEQRRQLDFGHEIPGAGRFRVSAFEQREGLGAVFRHIPEEVPRADALGLPEQLTALTHLHQGLILVTGPATSGKTTSMAAFVDRFNTERSGHIVTLEDPIEYQHPTRGCLVTQRQIGWHTPTFAAGLGAASRQDADLVMVGDLRDTETMRAALNAVDSGQLVVASVSTTSATRAIGRVIDSFPPREQPQVRAMLADALKLVLHQRLLRRADGQGRVACFEVLVVTPAIGNLIRENKIPMIPSAMALGRNFGMRQLDEALLALVEARTVPPEEAYLNARDKEAFAPLVGASFLEAQRV